MLRHKHQLVIAGEFKGKKDQYDIIFKCKLCYTYMSFPKDGLYRILTAPSKN